MLNPKIIYMLVAVVFIYIVAKFRLMPYLAAKKILKDAKNNGTQQTSAQPLTDQAAPAIPLQLLASMQQSQAPGGFPLPSAPAYIRPESRNVHFDYRMIETMSMDGEPVSLEDECKKVDSAVSQFLLDLRSRGICPTVFNIVHVNDGLLLAYVTYTL